MPVARPFLPEKKIERVLSGEPAAPEERPGYGDPKPQRTARPGPVSCVTASKLPPGSETQMSF